MTLTLQQRIERCADAIENYSDDDDYTNFVDLLADAMHWCQKNRHDMAAACDTAQMHFDAEVSEGECL